MTTKHADPESLASLLREVFGGSPLAEHFRGVDVSSAELDDKNEYIRILVHLDNLDRLSEAEADDITTAIETAIAAHDDRFPSVRFAEP